MSLELVTGPANAEKAGVVLDRTRELASAGADPILVVPTRPDVLAFRRELAAGGLVFGVRVETFSGLSREIAARTGRPSGGASAVVRLRVAEAAIAAARLDALAASAATPGFAAAFAGLCRELAEARIGPGLWYTAVRAWGEAEPARAGYAEELGGLYGAYRDRIDKAGGEPATRAYELHDALRLNPGAWDGVPVLFYGFDDFTGPELDAIRTLALIDAPVVVSLPYEDGREDVYRTRSHTLGELLALAGERHVQLPPGAEEDPALAHLERALLTPGPAQADAGDAVRLLVGGGERAELELIAETARAAIADGMAPEDIAVALRDSDHAAPLVLRVFAEAGVPVALERRVPVAHTMLGRGLLALLAAALPGRDRRGPARMAARSRPARQAGEGRPPGTRPAARRCPGCSRRARRVGAPRRLSLRRARRPRRARPRSRGVLRAPARTRRGAARAPVARERRGPPAGERARTPRRCGACRTALEQLIRLGRADAALAPDLRTLGSLLGAERVTVGAPPGPGLVTIADPLRLRARRVRLLLLGRMQEGVFPLPAGGDPFLGDAERLAINAAGGLRLRLREDRLDAERWLLYSAVSRPTERLVLSWHRGDDDGEPRVRSLFVDDVLACFTPALADRRDRPPPGRGRLRRCRRRAAPAAPRRGGRRARACARARARAAHRRRRARGDPRPRRLGGALDRAVGHVSRRAGSSNGCSGPSSWTPAPAR